MIYIYLSEISQSTYYVLPRKRKIPKFKENNAHVIHTWSHITHPRSCIMLCQCTIIESKMFLLLTNTIAQFWTRGVVKPVLSITTMFRWPFNELWATSQVLVAHNTVKNFKRWYVNECIPHTKKNSSSSSSPPLSPRKSIAIRQRQSHFCNPKFLAIL